MPGLFLLGDSIHGRHSVRASLVLALCAALISPQTVVRKPRGAAEWRNRPWNVLASVSSAARTRLLFTPRWSVLLLEDRGTGFWSLGG